MSDSASNADSSRESPQPGDAAHPARVGDLRIVQWVGRGRLGDVYKAYEQSLDRFVAVKVLSPRWAADERVVERFRGLATAAARVVHPNVVPIFSVGEDDDRHFIVMQWMEGGSLAARLEQPQPLSTKKAVGILKQCLTGLQAAHERGVTHGDVKPSNVLLEPETGRALLVDFCMAQVRDTSQPTDAYEDRRLGDLRSLGVTTYWMLTGQGPSAPDAELVDRLGQAALDVPAPLAEILVRMMAVGPEQPYQGAEDVLADLQALEIGPPGDGAEEDDFLVPTLRVPDFDPLPEPSADAIEPDETSWWKALKRHARSLFWAHAPEAIGQLQTTEQQVDRAVDAYQRRHDELAGMVEEGQQIAKQMARRRKSQIVQQARRPDTRSGQTLEEFTRQEGQLRERMEDLLVQKARMGAKLLELTNRRDLLRARLRSAQAQLTPDRPAAGGRRIGWRLAGGLLLAAVAAVWPVWSWFSAPEGSGSSAVVSPEVEPDSAPAAPQEVSLDRSTPIFPQQPPLDLSALPSATIRAFQGEPPPPYVLEFSGKQSAQFELHGLDRDWFKRSYTAVVAVRFQAADGPCRLMGNLDPRGAGTSRSGWALLAEPVGPQPTAAAGGDADWMRLTLVYTARDGTLERLSGDPFSPGDRWRRIAVSQKLSDPRITIHLDQRPYLNEVVQTMIRRPHGGQFWLGCPDFAQEAFQGEIGGFALHSRDYTTGRQFALIDGTVLLADFSHPQGDEVLDFSGQGRHGRLLGCRWGRVPRRPLRQESLLEPAPGRAFALSVPRDSLVELMDTRGLARLDGVFSAEIWVRGLADYGDQNLFGDFARLDVGMSSHYAGWRLIWEGTYGSERVFTLWYPGGPGRIGELNSSPYTLDDRRWYHVAFCSTAGRCQVFLDGKPLFADGLAPEMPNVVAAAASPMNLSLGKHGTRDSSPPLEIRAFRLSSDCRYDRQFTPPTEFAADDSTLVLLDFSKISDGPFILDASGAGRRGLRVLAPWFEENKTW